MGEALLKACFAWLNCEGFTAGWMQASMGNVRRNDGFTGEGSIFLPMVIGFPRLDSSHGFSVSPLGLTSFPPNEEGDNHDRQHDLAEQERHKIVRSEELT